jgi:membrane-bound ClpP family serine protease
MRKFWLSPNFVGNAILWIVGIALQIGGWVSQPIAYILFSVAFVWSILMLIYWLKSRKKKGLAKESIQSKLVVGGLIGRGNNVKLIHSHFKGKIITWGKHEDINAGGLIGQGENIEVVDSSADAEIEYKQGKE